MLRFRIHFRQGPSLLWLIALVAAGCATAPRSPAPSSAAPPSETPTNRPQESTMTAPSRSPASVDQAAPETGDLRPKPERPAEALPDIAAPTPPAGVSAPAAPEHAGNEYALGDQVEAWKNSLKNGAIEYRVPTEMIAQQPSNVTVNIHGYQDTQSQSLPDATGKAELKVSSKMKVELLAPVNPGEFTIAQQAGDPVQFVPNDGYATWMWNVTPANAATNQTLEIRVSLVYEGSSGAVDQILQDKTYTVSVNVQKLGVTIEQSFWKDPIAWFKYVLPGGAGWAALAALAGSIGGVITWWKKRKKKPVVAG